jgi:hypothetical protein
MAMAMPVLNTLVMIVSNILLNLLGICCNICILVLNFTHRIDEFSFGQLYPNLFNPLDNSIEISETRTFILRLCFK